MVKYKVRVSAILEFEIEADEDWDANGVAANYVDENRDEFDWSFDSIINTKTGKDV